MDEQERLRPKTCKESRATKILRVFPGDLNDHHTMFGGKLMAYIDDVASISAERHARAETVTASTDSVDFLLPITEGHSVCLTSYVTSTGRTSMEVFVKVVIEHLRTGERKIAATAFLTFVALDSDGKPIPVPPVIPETQEEKALHESAPARAEARRQHREQSRLLAAHLKPDRLWEMI
ncbi:acyl-CoA thioesterase [Alicyclobacillus mali]|uniref:Acyl-CoA thioesterase n=1 Tax=Alicyclobacillus mali (ex Roth et al. 2021) TaxID=1123961 RepID=A0ABS0F549_9BACL|nr:acyl-CoA thioesterase [Alicyclobacillus mali (ex Roth et al. 2021)]MBF8378432.1 acyl-CoA thioesterase [Alicyclobacillus mali (ex Roth et al. 2021)]MCL6488433.1 acyl-CoA thioesterase [Alicyclobacillus mali (ex Roth et al. 2021)]